MRGYFFGGGLFMGIITLIILGLVVFFGVKYLKNRETGETPLDILKARCAKGEISRESFDSMKKEL
ncbi:MAG: hypothetical protein A2W19_10545 [Spirochaetes bacterium RBG_16_49_21]|nr:MAG: hypothetical protein A2W19_10545 [Spirochaetes bacterium RBG_16_49_21]